MSKAKHRTISSRANHTCQSVTKERLFDCLPEGWKEPFFLPPLVKKRQKGLKLRG